MGKQISPDELQVGMRVTVLEWKPMSMSFPSCLVPGEEWKEGIISTTVEDQSYKGDVLTVKAVDYPFISVLRESVCFQPWDNIVLDARKVILMALSDDFVRGVCPHLFKDEKKSKK